MMNNICGNDASPLRGEVRCVADPPTLRIGLISGVPPAHRILVWVTLAVIFVTTIIAPACSSRVVYEPTNVVIDSQNAININTATADELERLPHIGRKTADAIVQFRTENGPFRVVEHIMQIRGMSGSRFAELRPFLKTE